MSILSDYTQVGGLYCHCLLYCSDSRYHLTSYWTLSLALLLQQSTTPTLYSIHYTYFFECTYTILIHYTYILFRVTLFYFCVLCIVCCVLCIVYCVLCIVYCGLCIVCCVLCVVYCILCVLCVFVCCVQ